MPATATSRVRALKQEYNTNPEAWGGELNLGALDMLDEAWGVSDIAVAAEVTLTSNDFISDQARSFVLECSGAGGFAVISPAVEKPYYVINDCTTDITIKPSGGTAATVRAGTAAFVYMNGTVARAIDPTLDKIKTAAGNVALGGNKLTGVGTATSATDAATLSNKVHEFATPTAALAMGAQKITGLADGTDAQDAVTFAQIGSFATSASTSADEAAASAAEAAISADEAAASATAAATFDPAAYYNIADDTATDAQLRAATTGKVVDALVIRTARSVATLTDGATITPDMNLGPNFTVTLGGNRTLANPTNQAAGQAGFIRIIQDGTGSRTLSYGANWKFSGGAPTLSTAAAAVDVIAYEVIADGTILATFAGEFS